ncbi:hypothetical protein ApAK_03725 [Thermoplasmatales archaeon AK]|nr:hypothetical protein [Thermoplasmatales archaeon AK]
MGIYWIINLILLGIEFLLLLFIVMIVGRTYSKTGARAMSGLVIFASLFLVQSLVSLVVYLHLAFSFGADLALLLMGINVIGLAGFSILYHSIRQ